MKRMIIAAFALLATANIFAADAVVEVGDTIYSADRKYAFVKDANGNLHEVYSIDARGHKRMYGSVMKTDPDMRIVKKSASGGGVYDVVEQMPQFPGGTGELMKFLCENIKYPADAEKQKIQGRVIVTFIVGTDGSVSDARVMKSVFPSLDAEALRVVGLMPRWEPGMQGGKAVRVKYTVPLTFKLN